MVPVTLRAPSTMPAPQPCSVLIPSFEVTNSETAGKEALTNIVRHSNATEVRLKILIIGNKLRVSLSDNGGGLNSTSPAPDMDGLNNMRMRLEKIGGRFGIASQTGRGTAIREACSGGVPMPREIARKVIAAFRQPLTAVAEIEELRPSEMKILELLGHGLSNKEIANRLGLSTSTVRWHLENIYTKFYVKSRTEAVLKFHSTKQDKLKRIMPMRGE